AFGDGNNDISMLDFAHTSIVMENASEEVKKHGKYITHSCDEDGISYAINKIKEGIWR
ncbi:MAG: HAD hydrolase family protein, partial [Bacilli bacterium]|nr:HAD hydrolase family protein [Bacilli bacterium]